MLLFPVGSLNLSHFSSSSSPSAVHLFLAPQRYLRVTIRSHTLVEVRTRLHWGWTEPFLSDGQTLGTFPDLNIVVSCLTLWLTAFPSVPPCSFIACRPIHKFFFPVCNSVKLPNCLEMFQSWKNTSQSSFGRIWAQCFGQGLVSRPLPLNPTNSSSFFSELF